jgi:hypothetical protein
MVHVSYSLINLIHQASQISFSSTVLTSSELKLFMTFSSQNIVWIPHFLMHLTYPSLIHLLTVTTLDEDEASCDK